MIDALLIMEVIIGIIVIYLWILLRKSIPNIIKNDTAHKEAGELLFAFRDEGFAKKVRRIRLLIQLAAFSFLIPYFVEVGTISYETVYEMLGILIMLFCLLFIARKTISSIRLIEVFSAGIKITQGPSKFFSDEPNEHAPNHFYHFSHDNCFEQNKSGAVKIVHGKETIVIESPKAIGVIIEAYKNFQVENQE